MGNCKKRVGWEVEGLHGWKVTTARAAPPKTLFLRQQEGVNKGRIGTKRWERIKVLTAPGRTRRFFHGKEKLTNGENTAPNATFGCDCGEKVHSAKKGRPQKGEQSESGKKYSEGGRTVVRNVARFGKMFLCQGGHERKKDV